MSMWLTKRTNNVPLNRMQQLMDRMMDDFWNPGLSLNEWGDEPLKNFQPKINVKEHKNGLDINAELPGLDEKDVELEISRDSVLLRGEKRTESKKDNEEKGRHYYECSYGQFQRRLPLPYEINMETASAQFKNGVLNIHLERAKEDTMNSRKIQIKTH